MRPMSTQCDPLLDIRPPVREALGARQPVVALESSLVAHGLPWPDNVETARAAEQAVRDEAAVPATIGIRGGRAIIGLDACELDHFARHTGIVKATSRDLAPAIAAGLTAATTVAGTIALAHRAGISVMATGGIGGAHRGPADAADVSVDLFELARTPVAVVCAGAKSILDILRTLEILESYAVPVVGYATDDFPAFYLRRSGQPVAARVDDPSNAAAMFALHWALGGAGIVLAQPISEAAALEPQAWAQALEKAEAIAREQAIRGKDLTPFLLARLAALTDGRTLQANRALVVANARLAAKIALALSQREGRTAPPAF